MNVTYTKITQVTLTARGKKQHDLNELVEQCVNMPASIVIIHQGTNHYSDPLSFTSSIRGAFQKANQNVTVLAVKDDVNKVILIKH